MEAKCYLPDLKHEFKADPMFSRWPASWKRMASVSLPGQEQVNKLNKAYFKDKMLDESEDAAAERDPETQRRIEEQRAKDLGIKPKGQDGQTHNEIMRDAKVKEMARKM
jgi:hypothetical protein